MAAIEEEVPGRATAAQRWLARGAIVAAAASVLVPLLGIGWQASLAVVIVGVVGLGVIGASVWWALTHKGIVRWLAIVLAVLAALAVLILYTSRELVWVVLVAFALQGLAVALGRAALRGDPGPGKVREYDAPPPQRPYLIMNPRSGGGKVAKFGLKEKAEALGAEVVLLEGPGTVDVGELARKAVADGADLLGVAGGDGTQALVAGIASEHDIPLLVISAGTRNHFALDLGLNREDPSTCLDALHDGVELHVDLGFIGDRPFVNNASFGAYAAIVQSPAYRDDKAHTTADMLPDLLVGHTGPRLVTKVDGTTVEGAQAVLVSNNAYGMGDVAGLGRRARLDRGILGVFSVKVRNAVEAASPAVRYPPTRPHHGDHQGGSRRRRRRSDPRWGRRRGVAAGHPGALHRATRCAAGQGAAQPPRGARPQTGHQLAPPVAAGPGRPGRWSGASAPRVTRHHSTRPTDPLRRCLR